MTFKFERSVNLGQIVISTSFVASALVAFHAVRTDVEVLKVHVASLAAKDVEYERKAQVFRDEIIDQLKSMNVKLEGIKERIDKIDGARGAR